MLPTTFVFRVYVLPRGEYVAECDYDNDGILRDVDGKIAGRLIGEITVRARSLRGARAAAISAAKRIEMDNATH